MNTNFSSANKDSHDTHLLFKQLRLCFYNWRMQQFLLHHKNIRYDNNYRFGFSLNFQRILFNLFLSV